MEDRFKQHCGRKKSVTVQANINILAQCIQRSSHASTRRINAHTGLDRSSIRKMLKKDLHVKAYHPLAVQALKAPDAAKRVKWAEDFLYAVMMDFTYPDHILWTDEAIFHLNGTVNQHNAITWATQNPHVYIERDTQKKAGVMLWVGLIKDNIIGPFFFDSSVTGDVYLRSVWPALRALMGDEINLVYFQQDGASAYYSKVARRWLDHTFKERWIGRAMVCTCCTCILQVLCNNLLSRPCITRCSQNNTRK